MTGTEIIRYCPECGDVQASLDLEQGFNQSAVHCGRCGENLEEQEVYCNGGEAVAS